MGDSNEGKLKPLFVEESTDTEYPQHWLDTISGLDKSTINEHILLLATIYAIGLEKGFYCSDDNETISMYWGYRYHFSFVNKYSKSFRLSREAEHQQIYTIELRLTNLPSRSRGFRVMAVKNGDTLIVTLIQIDLPRNSSSVVLPISKYVKNMNIRNYCRSFHNLKSLSILLKDRLFGPVGNSYCKLAGLNHPALDGLPDDLADDIHKKAKIQRRRL